jgi:hypothetical protein
MIVKSEKTIYKRKKITRDVVEKITTNILHNV